MTLQRARLKAEEKTLDFEFEVVNVQFNEKGRYALRLTVENPLLEGSGAGVRLQVNEGDVLYTSSGTTDIIEQSNLSEIYAFERRRFLFTLPKGFCKNDKNHDVRLRIEALRLSGPSLKSSLRAGEAFFAIYPRTNQPRMNLFARKDEDLYRYSDIMALLRVGEDELAMHCGRLAYAVSFHEHRLPARKETPVSSHQLSPWLSAREDGEQDGVHTQRAPFPVPLQSLDGPHHSCPHSTPEALTSSAYHSPPIKPRTLSAEQVTELPGEPDQRAFPELRNDSADEVHSSFSPPSSPAVPRGLLSSASFHLSSPGHSPELGSQDPFTGLQPSPASHLVIALPPSCHMVLQ
ncbi:coiled-coil domain-containing protein 33-like [Mauremys mutica]|nr:coiled-coil domain-containing protein 33-like [Mauremys mutica]